MKSIVVQVPAQTLELFDRGQLVRRYPVSTSNRGTGEKNGSFCTPRGRHLVRAKIGAGAAPNTVFVKRRPTGEVYDSGVGGALSRPRLDSHAHPVAVRM